MATLGGKREGAGRKKGQVSKCTAAALESKALFVKMFQEKQEPIFKVLLDLPMEGELPAVKEALDRGLGKPVESIDLTTAGEQFNNGVVFYVPAKRKDDLEGK